MDIHALSRALVKECYLVTRSFPPDERYSIVRQIGRAAISVYLNINEGCSRRSISERKRYFEIARGSIIEIDAALDISVDLDFCKAEALTKCGEYIIRSFSMLSKLMAKSQ